MNFIVTITGPSQNGHFSYRVTGGVLAPLYGRSEAPLLGACRMLKVLGGAETQDYAYLYREGRPDWDARCSVGWGATHTIRPGGFKREKKGGQAP